MKQSETLFSQQDQKFQELKEIDTQDDDKGLPQSEPIVYNELLTPKNTNKPYLGSYEEAPSYMKDNIYIHSGYRINFDTYKKSLRSAFMFSNNEFSNIWSHFIGIIITIGLIITIYSFIAKNDAGIIQKTTSQLDNIYEIYSQKIKVHDEGNSSGKWFNTLINSFDENDKDLVFVLQHCYLEHYSKQKYQFNIITFENLLKEAARESEKRPITSIQKQKIYLVYTSLKAKVTQEVFLLNQLDKTSYRIFDKLRQQYPLSQILLNQKQLQTDNLDWVDVYKIFGIDRFEVKDRRVSDPKQISKWPIFFYLLSSIGCFSGSVIYHTFNSMNEKLHAFLLRVDYAGICFILLGGAIPSVYYGFYCDSGLLYFYLVLVIFFCSFVFIISLFDFVHTQKYRKFKGILYILLGTSTGIPLFHLLYRSQFIEGDETDYLSLTTAYPFFFLAGGSLLVGLLVYLTRFPERFYPGKFDRIGNSHNIWHCFVISAQLFGYLLSIENYYQRKQTFCYLK